VVGNLGTFQDGGLHHNCPSDIAQWETRFVWPSKSDDPDFALSLGTGTSSARSISVKSRFLRRCLKSWMNELDAQKSYDQFINSLPATSRPRYHRLNTQFHGPEPGLDDALKIPEMKESVTRTIELEEGKINDVHDAIIGSIFYFALDGPPVPEHRGIMCSGYIHCRADLPPNGLRYLYEWLQQTSSWFLIQGNPTECVGRIPKTLPPFKKRIAFCVESESELITMSIRGITSTSQTISGFPTTLRKLIENQDLDSVFGTIDHSTTEKLLPAIPRKRSRASLRGDQRNVKRVCSSLYSS
jgi:hypothetical protein